MIHLDFLVKYETFLSSSMFYNIGTIHFVAFINHDEYEIKFPIGWKTPRAEFLFMVPKFLY